MHIPEVLLNNSIPLPLIGLGTWQLKDEVCIQSVKLALELGYRHLDTAHFYENHEAIGKGIQGFPREKLFLTSKFILPQAEHEGVEAGCDKALRELGTEYLDLYLLHYPDRAYDMAYFLHQAAELIFKQKVRAIGVSNFTQHHLHDLLGENLPIAVNQVEFHPYLNQAELLDFCRKHGIHVTSYRSLGKGVLSTDTVLQEIGQKHGKTAAQISLRWLIEENISVIPKAQSRKHLEENIQLFDFRLDAEDHAILDHLKKQQRFCENELSDFNY